MPGVSEHPPIQRFGECEINRMARTLSLRGRASSLQPRQFDLLLYLIDNRERVVPHDEIMRNVWMGVHVQDQSLRYALNRVRRAVGDRGDLQRTIRTYPRKGLRFVASVSSSRATGEETHSASSGASSFYGRGQFLAEAGIAFESLDKGGGGRVLLISGEAGVGKTTALKQIANGARERGYSVSQVRCDDALGGTAYWPWTQACRSLLGESGSEIDLSSIVKHAPELSWAMPELLVEGDVIGEPASDAPSARSRLFDGMASVLRELAINGPVVICMDDLHEADDDTLRMASHLVRVVASHRVLFAMSFRDPCNPSSAAFPDRISRLASCAEVSSLPLKGLTLDEFRALILDRFGVSPSDVVLEELHETTSGNPFFVIQLMNVLRGEDRLHEIEGQRAPRVRFTGHVQEVITRQAGMLPEESRRVLEIACVIGREFSISLLAAVCDVAPAELFAKIQAGFSSGVVCDTEVPGVCRFVHPLVREALYSGLPIGDRRELHRLVARALESMIEGSPSVRCTDLARHFAAAAPHEDSLRAIPYFLDAARRDVETAAFESACSAIEAATALAESQYITDKDLWCRLRLRLGVVYGLLARREESRATLSRAAADAMEVGRSDVVCEAALAFAPDLLAVETGVFDADLVRLLRLAVRVSDDGQASVLSRLLARLAVALHWSDDAADEIPALVDQALTVARESADPEAQRFADTAGKLAKYSPGAGWSPEWDFSDAAGSDASTALMRGVLKVTGLVELGDVRSAEAEIDRFSELVEGVRKASARWYSDMFGATIALMRGEYESVLELTKQYLKQGMDVGDRNAFHSFALQRAMMAVDVGGLEEYEHSVARMVAEFPAVEGWGAGLCFLESEIGLSEEARKRIDRLLDAGILSRTPRNSWLGTIGCLTLAARNLARRDLGTDLYELWRPYSGGLVVIGFGSFCWGAADRFLGVLSGMLGKREEARAHFDAAFAMNERCGALPALAHSYRDRGIMESSWSLRGGDPFLGRAMELSESLGMKRLTAQVVRDRNGFDSL